MARVSISLQTQKEIDICVIYWMALEILRGKFGSRFIIHIPLVQGNADLESSLIAAQPRAKGPRLRLDQ